MADSIHDDVLNSKLDIVDRLSSGLSLDKQIALRHAALVMAAAESGKDYSGFIEVLKHAIPLAPLAVAPQSQVISASPKEKTMENLPEKMTVQGAARIMGKCGQFVRVGLQRKLLPFGTAVKMSGKRWSYHISPAAFYKYLDQGEK